MSNMWTDPEHIKLLTEIMRKIDNLNGYEGSKDVLGEDLNNRACHAIGWDIDWDKVRDP